MQESRSVEWAGDLNARCAQDGRTDTDASNIPRTDCSHPDHEGAMQKAHMYAFMPGARQLECIEIIPHE